MVVRKPAVAGSFYPSGKDEITDFISKALNGITLEEDVGSAKAYVAPHAGYVYSGKTAAYAHKALSQKDDIKDIETIVIVGPNHTGYGTPISVSAQDWLTPLGTVQNDLDMAEEIAKTNGISKDEAAHQYEHSIEVQLPFIQYLFPEKKACFICMGDQSLEAAAALYGAISHAAKKLKRTIAVLASSDFNHYEPATITKEKDVPLFEQLERMDYKKFYELKEFHNESSCGYGPITVALFYAREHKAKKGILLSNMNSGDVTGDYLSVVDYASFVFV